MKEIVHGFILDEKRFGENFLLHEFESEGPTSNNSISYACHLEISISGVKDVKMFYRMKSNAVLKKLRQEHKLYLIGIKWI